MPGSSPGMTHWWPTRPVDQAVYITVPVGYFVLPRFAFSIAYASHCWPSPLQFSPRFLRSPYMLKSVPSSATPIWRTTQARVATWFGFTLMCVGMFMAILDIQVVATSLPTIQNALAISPDAMSWIQTAYLIAEVIAIPLTGWLTRALTLRWLFVSAISLFTAA